MGNRKTAYSKIHRLTPFLSVGALYVLYYAFSATFLNTGDFQQQDAPPFRVFSSNKARHLFLRKMYAPLRFVTKGRVHFLTEEEFVDLERYVGISRILNESENDEN